MSIFFERSDADGAINAADITRLFLGKRRESHGMAEYIGAKTRDGETYELNVRSLDRAIRMTLPLIPAHPGYFVLMFWGGKTEDEESYVSKAPVVAWRIDSSLALPVTPDDDDLDRRYSILCPDGAIITPYDRTDETEAAWRRFEETFHREGLQRKAKAKEPPPPRRRQRERMTWVRRPPLQAAPL